MKVSIVIPSRERARYLMHSLKTVTQIEDDDLEILVSDNASTDETADVVSAETDPRVRYVSTGERLSMRQNFEFALRNSTGDYIITFGDDDGMIPGQFPVLRNLLAQQKPDVVTWQLPTFGWPAPGYGRKTGGVRLRRDGMFGAPEKVDMSKRLGQLEQGQIEHKPPLPALYHGCMSRAYLDQLAGDGAPYFRARSPDVYISYRALQRGGNFWFVRHPLSINGFSPASTGGAMQNLGSETTTKSDTRFLQELRKDDVDDVIPVTKSMCLAFLGTLETARHLYPGDPVNPDYLTWYRLCLSESKRKNAEGEAEILASISAHAAQFNAEDVLAKARNMTPLKTRSLKDRASDLWAKRHSLRRSALIGGENTIATAARMCDVILGDDALAVFEGRLSSGAAWRNATQRSQQFDKQL